MKKYSFIILAMFLSISAFAQEQPQNHFKFYGFIRNYFAFDTRESVSGTGNLFYYLPKDRSMSTATILLNMSYIQTFR